MDRERAGVYRSRPLTVEERRVADQAIRDMVDRIVRDFDPLKVILFGSFARDEVTYDSDVDLLVVLPHVENKRETRVAIRRALTHAPVAKDIIVTTPEEIERRGDVIGTILRPALREGVTLYERP